MTQTLIEFLEAREAAIKLQMRSLQDELRKVHLARNAISSDAPHEMLSSGPRKTHRDYIMQILDERPDGATSEHLVDLVHAKFNVEIPASSMSSQLSRAKRDGLVTLDTATKIWRSANRLEQKNELPEGSSDVGGAATPSQGPSGTI